MKTYLPLLLCLGALGCIPVQDGGDGDPVRIIDSCGDGVCDAAEDSASCPGDCDVSAEAVCGDMSCDMTESTDSCPGDCTPFWCGDGFCDINDIGTPCEDVDCQANLCGNSFCDLSESTADCPRDCPVDTYCGDGTCDADENSNTCRGDCPVQPHCGDGACNGDETSDTCPGDCPRACVPECDGKTCGPDGCEGVCGRCSGAETCDAAGTCQPPPPAPESFEFTVQHSFTGPRAGATESISKSSSGTIYCDMDESTDSLYVSLNEGEHTVEMLIDYDPITWCLFNTSAFAVYKYVFSDASGFEAWGIDTLGNTSGLSLTCNRNSARTQLTGTFESEHLFRGRNSSATPSNYVDIQGGEFTCDL